MIFLINRALVHFVFILIALDYYNGGGGDSIQTLDTLQPALEISTPPSELLLEKPIDGLQNEPNPKDLPPEYSTPVIIFAFLIPGVIFYGIIFIIENS
jgi:hypothetical protein